MEDLADLEHTVCEDVEWILLSGDEVPPQGEFIDVRGIGLLIEELFRMRGGLVEHHEVILELDEVVLLLLINLRFHLERLMSGRVPKSLPPCAGN